MTARFFNKDLSFYIDCRNDNCMSDFLKRKKIFACWIILHYFLFSADFFENYSFKGFFPYAFRVSNILDPDPTLPDIFSGLMWVQINTKLFVSLREEG